MGKNMFPVDVISLCSANGEMRPLRVRMEDGSQSMRIDIVKISETKDVHHVGSEAKVFLCKARIGQLVCELELQYSIRTHTWWLLETAPAGSTG